MYLSFIHTTIFNLFFFERVCDLFRLFKCNIFTCTPILINTHHEKKKRKKYRKKNKFVVVIAIFNPSQYFFTLQYKFQYR